jgi:hypothetical protein
MAIAPRPPVVLAAFVALLPVFSPRDAGAAGKDLSLLQVAKDPLLEEALYRKPERLASRVAPSGAVSVNAEWERGRRKDWYIEQQRYGADWVQAGIIRRDRKLVERGWKILTWGFARQARDGSFPGTGDAFHSTSLFVEAAARALLLLKQSQWDGSPALLVRYQPKVVAAARWLLRPEVARRGRHHNLPYTHRRWLLAAALGESAALSEDRPLARAAAEYAREGLRLQTRSGINPEKGGPDVAYQAAGILWAGRYYTVCPDSHLRQQIQNMIDRGLQWELTQVDAQGRVSLKQSTRTGKEKGRSGRAKTVNYKILVQALTLGRAVTGAARYQSAAKRIAAGQNWIKP